jgi:hypothetical protein
MSLDATKSYLTDLGVVSIFPGEPGREAHIEVSGFEGRNCSCRDIAVLACLWAIGELQREILRTIEQPGGGNISV